MNQVNPLFQSLAADFIPGFGSKEKFFKECDLTDSELININDVLMKKLMASAYEIKRKIDLNERGQLPEEALRNAYLSQWSEDVATLDRKILELGSARTGVILLHALRCQYLEQVHGLLNETRKNGGVQ